jgi:hypothetical protein
MDAIRRRKFVDLEAHVTPFKGVDMAAELAEAVLLSNNLILQHADEGREKSRDAFLAKLAAYANAEFGNENLVGTAIEQVRIAESGYRKILIAIYGSAFWQLPASVRIAAVLSRAKLQHDFVRSEIEKAIEDKRFEMMQGLVIKDGNGNEVPPDAIIEPLIVDAGSSLKMLAYENDWISADGTLVIPDLMEVSEDDMFKAGSNEAMSHAWHQWSRVEEEARLLDGRLEVSDGVDMIVEGTATTGQLVELHRGKGDWYDWAAQVRMNDHATQDAFTVMTRYQNRFPIGKLPATIAMPPRQFVSEAEVLAGPSLDQRLMLNIQTDIEEIGGLRIAEWLRGLGTLAVLSEPSSGFMPAAGFHLPVISDDELVAVLVKVGLTEAGAARFIDHMTFKWANKDLFDAPLIQQADGRKILFTPALIGTNHATILMSVFSTLNADFARKGKAFETRVIADLRRQGLDARAVKVKRDGQEYEFDVLLPWDGYVFLFECKNRSIPRGRPVDQREFRSTTDEQIDQVNRLAGALTSWPEILSDEFGRDLSGATIVPIVFNNLPYARSGPTDGVYFYDYSALSRFFQSGHLNLKMPGREPQQPENLVVVTTVKMWGGEVPTAADLFNELQDPAQLRFKRFHTYTGLSHFWLDEGTVCQAPLFREIPATPLTAADCAGVPRRKVLEQIERGRRKFKKQRQKAQRRTQG